MHWDGVGGVRGKAFVGSMAGQDLYRWRWVYVMTSGLCRLSVSIASMSRVSGLGHGLGARKRQEVYSYRCHRHPPHEHSVGDRMNELPSNTRVLKRIILGNISDHVPGVASMYA